MTGLYIIRRALSAVGVRAITESVSAEDAEHARQILKGMLDTWRTQRMLCYFVEAEDYTFVSGQQVYTYGPGGNFNAVRPVFVDRISAVQDVGTPQEWEQGLVVVRSDQEWQAVPNKTETSTWPQKVYVQMDNPLIRLKFWPVVAGGPTLTARIYRWVSIEGLLNLSTDYTFAPGFEEAIIYNLAVRCAPDFGMPVPATVQTLADESMGNVKRTNQSYDVLVLDPTFRRARYWDVYSGTYVGMGP